MSVELSKFVQSDFKSSSELLQVEHVAKRLHCELNAEPTLGRIVALVRESSGQSALEGPPRRIRVWGVAGNHTAWMNSRVHPKYKTKYRVKNWASYDRGLVQRGDVTVWLSPEAIAAWEPPPAGKRGGQLRYSDLAIETAVTLRLIFNLPLRQTEGFLNSLFGLMGVDLSVPDHTTLSRRSQRLVVKLRRTPA